MTGKPVILVGDVGGTTTDLALLDETLAFHEIRSFASREYDSLNDIVRAFLRAEAPTVPTPVLGLPGRCRTNR